MRSNIVQIRVDKAESEWPQKGVNREQSSASGTVAGLQIIEFYVNKLHPASLQQTGRSFQLMVRGFKPEIQEILLRDPNVFDFKAVRPNLEELYIGFTQPLSEADMASLEPWKPVSEVA